MGLAPLSKHRRGLALLVFVLLSAGAAAMSACSSSGGGAAGSNDGGSSSGQSSSTPDSSTSDSSSPGAADAGQTPDATSTDGNGADSGAPGDAGGFTVKFASLGCTDWSNIPFPGGSQTRLDLDSLPYTCASLLDASGNEGVTESDSGALEFTEAGLAELARFDGNLKQLALDFTTNGPTLAATTYTVTPPCGSFYQPDAGVAVTYQVYDSNGLPDVFLGDGFSGTVKLTSVSATQVSGSFDLSVVDNDYACTDGGTVQHLTGTFTTTSCAPLSCGDAGM